MPIKTVAKMMDGKLMKECTVCGKLFELNATNFYRASTGATGLAPSCKKCVNRSKRPYFLTEKYKEKSKRPWYKEYLQRAKIRHSKDNKARWELRKAVKSGKLIKKPCEVCGSTKRVEGHHFNGYDKPNWLKVKWLCQKHHREAHYGSD